MVRPNWWPFSRAMNINEDREDKRFGEESLVSQLSLRIGLEPRVPAK